ncbi:sensor histidine kinase [Gulosibacter chungangensis]|nr:histidine kinase [Gulosibacter chungangensis]
MNQSFIATHERPRRVLLMDAISSLCVLPCVLLVFGGYEPAASWLLLSPVVLLFLIRRTAPITFLWLATVLAGASYGTGFALEMMVYLVVLVGVYGAAAFTPKRMQLLGFVPLFLAVLVMVLDLLLGLLPDSGSNFFYSSELAPEQRWTMVASMSVVSTIAFVAAWALGMLRRSQLKDVARQRERADLLERDAHRLAELAVTEERTRISREMHDIIAHSLASILTLAEGGRMGTKQAGSEHSHELFNKIAGASRSALGEVKVLLKQVDEAQSDAPAYGLADIADLAENARLAGLPLEFSVQGEPRPIPAGHSLAVYRVAQESITNVLKHAPGQHSEMLVTWGQESFSVLTRNTVPEDFAEQSEPIPGKGIVGMRERAEIFNGQLRVTRTAHLFEVFAEWPYPEGSQY